MHCSTWLRASANRWLLDFKRAQTRIIPSSLPGAWRVGSAEPRGGVARQVAYSQLRRNSLLRVDQRLHGHLDEATLRTVEIDDQHDHHSNRQ